MPTVIPVKFAYAARDLWFDPAGTGAQEGDHVICSTERGTEIGLATEDARELTDAELEDTIGRSQLKSVVRIATEEDLARAEELAEKGEASMPAFRRLVTASGLEMKPVGVEYLFDGEKAVCYFAAEDRVDFRQLVRDLSREFHVRIDMRQIGVREEAAIVGGYGHCGQELCCRRFNMGFEPVSIRMAKEQDLPLNSTKISGACGRLMCCLRYEFEAYRDFKTRAPKRNAVIDTPLGKGKIIEYDTPKEQLCLRLENGKQIRVALADMTTSEAAHKKSEELGCPCRPDTVTREVLEKLESPDVQMALAELDRRNGVVPEQRPDASDIFVSPARKRRRSEGGSGSAGRGAADGRGGFGAGDKNARGEKPQRGAHFAPSGEEGASGAGVATTAGSAGTSRRRHKRRPGDGGAGEAPTQAPEAGTRRRRHHQAGEGAPVGAGVEADGGASGSGSAGGAGGAKRTRRLGNRGGGMRPSRTRRPGSGAGAAGGPGAEGAQGPKGGQGSEQGSGQQGGPSRRRRRGGRGRGGAGSSGSGAPSSAE